jgi:rod shape-determining protein MreD
MRPWSRSESHTLSAPQPAHLLLPVHSGFIGISLLMALFLNMLQNILWLGRAPWAPDWLAIVLVFWSVHQPSKIGIGIAFGLGLIMDCHTTTFLGQHGLSYALLSFLGITVHRRLLWFSWMGQILQVIPVFLAGHVIDATARLITQGHWPDHTQFFAPVLEGLCWPWISFLLLAPQRRPPDPDENRPL